MVTNYNQEKENVLMLYKQFCSIADKSGLSKEDKSLIALSRQAENVKKDRFILMIAGEAKSGKSSFINAYLGEEILPMDVKQCTSSIVKVNYGTEFSLTAKYADGKKSRLTDSNNIQDFLSKNAALNDDYRKIPIPTINNEILIKYKGKIPDNVISDLILGVQSENIYGLSSEDYSKSIKQYIADNKDKWQKIVLEMEITYPFKDETLKGIEIIDSPGVNAEGRVGDVTDSYIENANAIMFLKPITGAALESSSFKSFLNNKSVERSKSSLFLILTRAGNENLENLERLQNEAFKLYGKKINKEQIIYVDSKVELFMNLISKMTVEEIEKYLDELEESRQLDAFIQPPRSMRILDKGKYITHLKKISNYSSVDYALNVFGRKSHYIALSELLDRMLKVCTKMSDEIEDNISLYQTKLADPTELAKRIGDIKNEISTINAKMSQTVNEIIEKYTGDDGIIRNTAKNQVNDFKVRVNSISEKDEDALNLLEKISFEKIDTSKELQESMQKNIVAECNEVLITLSNESKIHYSSLEPDFTPETFENIVESTRSDANEDEKYTSGKTFKKTESRSVYSRKKHFEILKPNILNRINDIQNQAINNLIDFANGTSKTYIEELAGNSKNKKDELDKLLQEKKTTDEINNKIQELRCLIEEIDPMVQNMQKIKGGIDSNV